MMEEFYCTIPSNWFDSNANFFPVFAMFNSLRDAREWVEKRSGGYGIIKLKILMPNPAVPYSYQIITENHEPKD